MEELKATPFAALAVLSLGSGMAWAYLYPRADGVSGWGGVLIALGALFLVIFFANNEPHLE